MVISEDAIGVSVDGAISNCIRAIVAAILLENNVEDVDDPTCLAILEQIMTKSIIKKASLTQSFAEHAMRSQAHFSDAIMALAFSGVDIPRLKTYFKDYKYPKILEGVKLVSEVAHTPTAPAVFQSGDQRKLPKYIQDYYPPMPSVYTFEATSVQKQNKTEYKQVREKHSVERRQVDRSLTAFRMRVFDRFDSPFQLSDPNFSLLPATDGITAPVYISALVPSLYEDRRTEEVSLSPVKEQDGQGTRRDEEETQSIKDGASESQPRKYKRHGSSKKHAGDKRSSKGMRAKQGSKNIRQKEIDHDESNSMFSTSLFSPGQ